MHTVRHRTVQLCGEARWPDGYGGWDSSSGADGNGSLCNGSGSIKWLPAFPSSSSISSFSLLLARSLTFFIELVDAIDLGSLSGISGSN